MGIDNESVHSEFETLTRRIAELTTPTDECLVEQIYGDCDITVPILMGDQGPVALPPARQTVGNKFSVVTHGHKRKLLPGLKREFPSHEAWSEPLVNDALRFAHAIKPYDYLRCDFRHGPEGHALLECNVGCSIGKEMAFAQSAQKAGISFEALVEHILVTSLDRQWGTHDQLNHQICGH